VREPQNMTKRVISLTKRTSGLVHKSCCVTPVVHRTGQCPAHLAATLPCSDMEVVTVTDSVQGGRAPRVSRAAVAKDRPGGELADHGEPRALSLPESGGDIRGHCRGGDRGAIDIAATDDTSEVIVAVGVPRAWGFVGLVETVPGPQAARFCRLGRAAVAS